MQVVMSCAYNTIVLPFHKVAKFWNLYTNMCCMPKVFDGFKNFGKVGFCIKLQQHFIPGIELRQFVQIFPKLEIIKLCVLYKSYLS